MAIQSLSSLDLKDLPLRGLRIENRSEAPPHPGDGSLYFDTSVSAYRLYQGGVWFELATGGVLVGLASERPQASISASGQMFFATDTSELSIDIGGEWVVAVGSSPSVSSAGNASIQSPALPVGSVAQVDIAVASRSADGTVAKAWKLQGLVVGTQVAPGFTKSIVGQVGDGSLPWTVDVEVDVDNAVSLTLDGRATDVVNVARFSILEIG